MIVTVKKVFKKQKKDGSGDYDVATLVDENGKEHTFGIWEDKHLYVEGNVLDINTEKKGNFLNITSVESASAELAEKVDTLKIIATEPVPVDKIRVDKKPESDGRNRSFALAYAKDYHCARIRAGVIKDIPESEIIATAILFESYLDKGG